jgi:hypothetical protein
MISLTANFNGLKFNATVVGMALYLDNFALINLAKHDPIRRKRFLDVVHSGADLLFSVSNAVDLAGPQGRSRDLVRDFLDHIGPHWYPVELNVTEVVHRELSGAVPGESCLSTQFMKDYFVDRLRRIDKSTLVDLSKDFFRLGSVLDWVGEQRDSIQQGKNDLDTALADKIKRYRSEFQQSPDFLDKSFPILPFNAAKPVTFVYVNLIRHLVMEAKQHPIKRGDGLDFSHAVISSAFANVSMLDKHWKRRIESLPKPNQIARIFYDQEFDQMIDQIEAWQKLSGGQNGSPQPQP